VQGHPDDRPAWAQRIRQERVTRRWSQAEAVRALRVHFPSEQIGDAGLLLDWKRWESGRTEPDATYKPLLAKTFGTVTGALFPTARDGCGPLDQAKAADTEDLLERMRAPHLDDDTVEALTVTVDELCTRYATAPAVALLPQARTWLGRLTDALNRRLTLDQHRDILQLAGFLALLIGCLENDLGLTTSAETSRRAALSVGQESNSADLTGWAHELRAWYALTQGDYRTVIAAAAAGQATSAGRPVAAQLWAQAAKAWARIGERRQVEVALDQARSVLEALAPAEHLGNHFVVDPSRFDLWAMDCYRLVGEDRLAAGYAREVLRNGIDTAGRETSPMRNSAAQLTLGVVAARNSELEAAVYHGTRALRGERTSLPSLLMASRELRQVLDHRFAAAPETAAYAHEVRFLENKLLHWSTSADG